MEFFELISKRYSVRSYKPNAVEDEKLQQVLEAARIAPTACNLQPFKLVVMLVEKHLDTLKKICRASFFTQAPVVIGIYADMDAAWVRKDGKTYADVDAAIVMDHIILAATSLGLGTCWIGAFDAQAARDASPFGEGFEPIAFTPIGYPTSAAPEKQRKSMDDIVVYL
jgi:nitroreductase